MSNVTPMSRPNVHVIEGEARTSSRDVAEYFQREHRTVLRAIEQLQCSDQFRLHNFVQSSYLNEQGKSQPGYEMTKNGFTFLAMGFTGKRAAEFKERYISAFDAMEAKLRDQQSLPAHAARLIEQLQEAMSGGDPRTVPMADVEAIFRTAEERTEAIRNQLNELDAELGYLRDAIANR